MLTDVHPNNDFHDEASTTAPSPSLDSPPVNDNESPQVTSTLADTDHDGDRKLEDAVMHHDKQVSDPTPQGDAMDVDAVKPHPSPSPPPVHLPSPPAESTQSQTLPVPNAPSPAPSHNTVPSMDQLRITPKLPSPSPSASAPHSPTVNGAPPPAPTPSVPNVHPADEPAPGDDERPAKRPRNAYEEHPASPSSSRVPQSSSPSVFSPAQIKFAISTIRTIKRSKDSLPFHYPVDPISLNIPHYPNIIKNPMDFSTVEKKLFATKKGSPSDVGIYNNVDEFITDVRLIWENSYAFNGRQHAVSLMAERMSEVFEKQIKQMPPPEEPKPAASKPPPQVVAAPAAHSPTASHAIPKKPVVRRPSTSVPVRKSEPSPVDPTLNVNSRPKREIHAPPPKDLTYHDGASSSKIGKANSFVNGVGKKARRDDGTAEQLKFCGKILQDMYRKQYQSFAYFFYDPVDASFVPNYYKVIKKPMDLSTMRKKLDQGEYLDASKFHADFMQIIKNCMTFNPEGSPVREAGNQLRQLFLEKWANLPPLKASIESEDEDSGPESDDASDAEKENVIRQLETQVSTIQQTIETLKASLREKRKRRERAREERHAMRAAKATSSSHRDNDPSYGTKTKKPRTSSVSNGHVHAQKANGTSHASSSKHKPTSNKTNGTGKKTKQEVQEEDAYDDLDSPLDNVQKKELSEAIEKLEGNKLEKVIMIIQEGVPGIGDNSEEIELEIDALPSLVLQRLYNFVVRPLKLASKPANAYKVPKRTGSGNTGRTGAAATGGVKRKSMDEAAEAEKIRTLEEKARLLAGGFPGASAGTPQGPGMGAGADEDDSVQSSEESGSDSDSDSD
ncbi:hypothetical protein FRB99_007738 [Tulasnella sp. 403]|nr:hypothetical protein FRB99_007738 [Tulasnella sp. 403]